MRLSSNPIYYFHSNSPETDYRNIIAIRYVPRRAAEQNVDFYQTAFGFSADGVQNVLVFLVCVFGHVKKNNVTSCGDDRLLICLPMFCIQSFRKM